MDERRDGSLSGGSPIPSASSASGSALAPEARTELAMLATEVAASGRLQDPEALRLLLPLLERDLAEYPPELVVAAIREHRRRSPFWPALSDLVTIMEELEAEQERRLRRARQVWLPESDERFQRAEVARKAIEGRGFPRVQKPGNVEYGWWFEREALAGWLRKAEELEESGAA